MPFHIVLAAMLLVPLTAMPVAAVTISSVSPQQHDNNGGSIITIKGTGFASGMQVTINAQQVAPLTFYHPTTMMGRVPSH